MAEHIVYDATANNVVIGIYETNAEAVAEASKNPAWGSTQITNDDNVDIGWYVNLGVNPVTASATVPSAAAISNTQLQQYRRISAAFNSGIDALNRECFYQTRMGLATAADLNAAVRWCWINAALMKNIEDGTGTILGALSASARADRFSYIEETITNLSVTQFVLFVGDSAAVTRWNALSTSDGAAISTDLLSSTAARRSADGSAIAIGGAVIPEKFSPHLPALT